MAGLVISVINGERYDKPGEKIDEGIELKLKGKTQVCQPWWSQIGESLAGFPIIS